MNRRGSIIPGLMLVLFGMLLLLDRIGLYYFTWSLFLPGAAFILGQILWINCLRSKTRCHVFWGTILVVLGGFFFLWNYGTIDTYMFSFWPVFPTAVGLALISMFMVNWRHWWALIPGLPLTIFGGSYLIYYLGYIDVYRLEDILYSFEDTLYRFGDFYPLLFVLLGVILIIMSVRKSRKRPGPDISHK